MNWIGRSWQAGWLCWLCCISCFRTEIEDFKPQLNVHCVLFSNHDVQTVKIDRTYAIDERAACDLTNVSISLTNGSVVFAPCSSSFSVDTGFCFWISTGDISMDPSERWSLTACADNIDTLMGVTVLPGDFAILKPAHGDTISIRDTIRVEWSGGSCSEMCATISMSHIGWLYWRPGGDSLLDIPLSRLLYGSLFYGPLSIELFALDSNYVHYTRYWQIDSVAQCGVTAGLGVFGSCLSRSVDVWVFPD